MSSPARPLQIGILGADGRMGRSCVRTLAERADMHLAAAFTRDDADTLGQDAGTLAGVARLDVALTTFAAATLESCDVLIDFSLPSATQTAARAMADSPCRALVTGTTGQTDAELAALNARSSDIALLRAGNFSLGVTLMTALVECAARILSDDYDIEVDEAHHRHKRDSPSGTAILLGGAAARGRDIPLDFASERDGLRPPGAIGLSVRRAGGIIGEHTVAFVSERERLSLSHTALDRSVFADGALTAARWLHGRAPGLYTMRDVLGLE